MDNLEIREITDFSKARKNPYAERIRKNGFSVTVHYGPEEVEKIMKSACEREINPLELDEDELKALEKYRRANRIQ
jgi:hypothetical protein